MKRFSLIYITVISLVIGCGKKEEEEEIVKAIPDGTFQVGAKPAGESIPARMLCSSDNTRPILAEGISTSSALQQLAKFGELVVNSLTITVAGEDITKVWTRGPLLTAVYPDANTMYSDEECTITWRGKIAKNEEDTFQESATYIVNWEPESCQIELHNWNTEGGAVGSGTWLSAGSSGVFSSGSLSQNADPWKVTASGNYYVVKMPDDVAALQTAYTCADETKTVHASWVLQ